MSKSFIYKEEDKKTTNLDVEEEGKHILEWKKKERWRIFFQT